MTLAAAACLATASVAGAQTVEDAVEAQLDSDPKLERLVRVSQDDGLVYALHYAGIEDECSGGTHIFRVTPPRETLALLETREMDGNPAGVPARIEVYAEGRSGINGRHGIARIVRWDPPIAGSVPDACGVRNILFSYNSTKPRPVPPRDYQVGTFGVRIRDYARSRLGLEVRLQEWLPRRGQPLVTACRMRVSFWSFDADEGDYVRYSSRIRRICRR